MEKNILIPWELLGKHFRLEATVEENEWLNEWLEDADHYRLYQELSTLWLALMKEGSDYHSHTDELWARMEQRMHASQTFPRKSGKGHFRRWAMAAACLLLLILGGAGYVAVDWYRAHDIHQLYTTTDQKEKIRLPDGTGIWLNAYSELTYTTTPFARKRDVSLRGEAFFEVAKDAGRPFTVNTGKNVSVQVHGTRFNVKARTTSPDLEVSLLSGSVSLLTPSSDRKMLPGEKAFYDTSTGRLTIRKVDTRLESLWAAEALPLERLSLRQTAACLSKWYDAEIKVDADVPDDQLYTLTIQKDDTLESILQMLSDISPIHYRFIDKRHIEITNR